MSGTDSVKKSDSVDGDLENTSSSNLRDTVVLSHPTIRPTIIRTGFLITIVVSILFYLEVNPELLTNEQITNIGKMVILILGAITSIRLFIRMFILLKTEYKITHRRVQRNFTLAFRTYSRAVPLDRVRSHELRQNSMGRLLGFGTISINQGLGEIKLENIQEPHDVYRRLCELTDHGLDDSL